MFKQSNPSFQEMIYFNILILHTFLKAPTWHTQGWSEFRDKTCWQNGFYPPSSTMTSNQLTPLLFEKVLCLDLFQIVVQVKAEPPVQQFQSFPSFPQHSTGSNWRGQLQILEMWKMFWKYSKQKVEEQSWYLGGWTRTWAKVTTAYASTWGEQNMCVNLHRITNIVNLEHL